MVTDTVRNRVVMFGGGSEDTWVFDGSYWTQLETTGRPPARHEFGEAFDAARGRVVLFGGYDPSGSWPPPPTGTFEFDGTTWQQVQTTVAPSPRLRPAMAYDAARAQTVLFGGENPVVPSNQLADTWVWDGAVWQQRTPVHSPPYLYYSAMAYDALRQRVVLYDTFARRTWEWDGSDWTQVFTAMTPTARMGAKLCYRPDTHRLMLFSGSPPSWSSPPQLLTDTWEYDGIAWTQLATTAAPPARARHGLAWDPVGARPLLFGGQTLSGSTNYGDTWTLAGANWTRVPMPEEPRSVIGMTYDTKRERIIALTGNSSPVETWEFDGCWHRIASSQVPLFSWHQPIVFDSWRNITVTFSGAYEHRTLAWQGAGWHDYATANLPPARWGFALGFDPSRGVAVLFGGERFVQYNDTWEFDGIDWTQCTPLVSPPVLRRASMAFHSGSNRLVMFGGDLQYAGPSTDGTWEYDGITWTQRTSAVRPPPRAGAALTPDPWTGDLILAGGASSSPFTARRDSWRWDGASWHATPPQAIQTSPSQSAAADPDNAIMNDGNRWWRWTLQPAIAQPPSGTGCGSPAPELVFGGRPFLGNRWFRMHVEPMAPDAIFALFADFVPATVVLGGGCQVYLGTPILFCIGCATPTGVGQATVPIPRLPVLRGCVLHLQGLAGASNGPLLGVAALTGRRTLVLGD